MDLEQTAISQGNEIIAMLGTEGIFAIIGTIFIVRTIRTFRYWEKWQLFVMNIIVAGLVGAGSTYYIVEGATDKQVSGGAFLCIVGSMVAYELLRWALAFAYEKTEMESIRVLYFFLSPAPMKTKDRGLEVEVPPHPSLTQFFEKSRLDK